MENANSVRRMRLKIWKQSQWKTRRIPQCRMTSDYTWAVGVNEEFRIIQFTNYEPNCSKCSIHSSIRGWAKIR